MAEEIARVSTFEFFPRWVRGSQSIRTMLFVDGENFAIRYGKILGTHKKQKHVHYEPSVFVWSDVLTDLCMGNANVIRKYYYTSALGDRDRLDELTERLKGFGIEAPRVYKRTKNRRSKRVDIALATEMLMHAHRGNYDVAVLIAGDEDYVPLVEAVQLEGCRVFVWFLDQGASPSLRVVADKYDDVGAVLFSPEDQIAY